MRGSEVGRNGQRELGSFDSQNVLLFPALLQMWGSTAEKSSSLGKGLALITRAQENLTLIHSISPQPTFEGLRNSVTRPWWNSIFLRNTGFLQNLAEISVNNKKFISLILQHSKTSKLFCHWPGSDLPHIPSVHFVGSVLNYCVSEQGYSFSQWHKQVLALGRILGNSAG